MEMEEQIERQVEEIERLEVLVNESDMCVILVLVSRTHLIGYSRLHRVIAVYETEFDV